MEPQPSKNIFLPISILVAAVLISGALVYNAGIKSFSKSDNLENNPPASLDALKSVTKDDHIRGDISASVKIITFEDTECPFCKIFHSTMRQIMSEYGDKVVWIYRHFPLEQLHPKAFHEAVALECANELGGNNKFWSYLDKVFEITPSNNGLDPGELLNIAENLGLDRDKFESCLASKKFDKRIADNVEEAIAVGGNGTPYSIVIAKSGKKFPINGALPLAQVKTIIEEALR